MKKNHARALLNALKGRRCDYSHTGWDSHPSVHKNMQKLAALGLIQIRKTHHREPGTMYEYTLVPDAVERFYAAYRGLPRNIYPTPNK